MKLIVLGMHRSGTALVTQLFSKLGYFVGTDSDLTDTNEENPKGFYERRDFRKINDELLFSNTSDWDKLSRVLVEGFSKDSIENYAVKFKEILNQLDSKSSNCVIKEPRFCLTYPYIKPLLREHKVVYVVRNPLDVAYSLYRRNNFPFEFGLALWEVYNTQIMNAIDVESTFIVDYDDVVNFNSEVLEGLTSFSGMAKCSFDDVIDVNLNRSSVHRDSISHYLLSSQSELYNKIRSSIIQPLEITQKIIFIASKMPPLAVLLQLTQCLVCSVMLIVQTIIRMKQTIMKTC